MQKFNKIVSVSVSLDSVANMVLKVIDKDNPLRESIAYMFTGIAAEDSRVGELMRMSLGIEDSIDIKVGDTFLYPHEELSSMYNRDKTLDAANINAEGFRLVKVIEVNMFAKKKVKVAFDYPERGGAQTRGDCWVDHILLKEAVKSEIPKGLVHEDIFGGPAEESPV